MTTEMEELLRAERVGAALTSARRDQMIKTGQDEIEILEMQIRVNEMLPPHLRCDRAIAEMKARLSRLKRPRLELVKSD